MEVKHNNTTYILDFDAAFQLGALKKKKRKIRLPDIKNGMIFRWICDLREHYEYFMVDNSSNTSGQCIALGEFPRFTFFADTEDFAILDVKTAKWITEID